MPFECIAVTRDLVASNPSTSYIFTFRRAPAFGGSWSCHCQETLRDGCQQPAQGTGSATRGVGPGMECAATAGAAPTRTRSASMIPTTLRPFMPRDIGRMVSEAEPSADDRQGRRPL